MELGLVFFPWGKGRLYPESGEFCPLYQGRPSNFKEGDNSTTRIYKSVISGEFQYVEFLVFTYNMVFESVYYKGTSKILLLFEIFLRLRQVHMRGYLILYVAHIAGTRMIEAVIDGILRVNNLEGTMRGVNPLKFVSVDEGAV